MPLMLCFRIVLALNRKWSTSDTENVGIWISVLSLRPWEACSDGTPQRLSLNQYFSRTRAEQCLKMACLLISAEMLKQLKCSHHLKELMSSCKTYKLFKSVADEPMWCLPLFFLRWRAVLACKLEVFISALFSRGTVFDTTVVDWLITVLSYDLTSVLAQHSAGFKVLCGDHIGLPCYSQDKLWVVWHESLFYWNCRNNHWSYC